MKKGKVHIGTSGWNYKHWKGNFYPENIADADEFSFYKKKFKTVEINSSFYHLPPASSFSAWKKQSPAGFIFSVKASRYITHNKKLITNDDSLKNFLQQVRCLKEKLGPVLFQLPPGWKKNSLRLKEFLEQLPSKYRYTFEFRNPTWLDEEIYELLKSHNCAFCIYDLAQFLTPSVVTTDFVYIRFHGPGNKYQGSYSKIFLKKWAKKIISWKEAGLDVYVYFDNNQEGYAAFNAQTLIELTS